jgi:putative hemolysin
MTTGCTSASRLAVTGTVNVVPATPTNPVHASRCGAGNVEIEATVPGGVTIDWYNDATGGTPFATDDATITVSATSSATYYAQARNTTTGCVSATRLPVTVTVNPDVAQATITGNSSNSCPTKTVPLTAAATGATNYTWYRNGSQVQDGTSPNYTVSSTGNYTVAGYNAYCFGATSTAKSVTINFCGDVQGCDNVYLINKYASNDGKGYSWDGEDYCAAQGGRLANSAELKCMCENLSNVPGGLEPEYYWNYNGTITHGSTCRSYGTDNHVQAYWRCVKNN